MIGEATEVTAQTRIIPGNTESGTAQAPMARAVCMTSRVVSDRGTMLTERIQASCQLLRNRAGNTVPAIFPSTAKRRRTHPVQMPPASAAREMRNPISYIWADC